MQNTKIQALWQLCQELKNRREVLVEKMHQNQAYLDEQQWAMSEEVRQLKGENQALFAQVHQLIQEVHQLQEILQQPASASASPAYEELSLLHGRYTELANQLDISDSLYQSRSALLDQLQKTHQQVHYEFKALKDNNASLVQDLHALQDKTNQLIDMVESYRQAALEAYAEVEKMQDSAPTSAVPEADDSNTSAEEGFDSKAEAMREAVRKKIVVLLRHRMGKVPRQISNALKEVTHTKTMDALFEVAMTAESLDEFSQHL